MYGEQARAKASRWGHIPGQVTLLDPCSRLPCPCRRTRKEVAFLWLLGHTPQGFAQTLIFPTPQSNQSQNFCSRSTLSNEKRLPGGESGTSCNWALCHLPKRLLCQACCSSHRRKGDCKSSLRPSPQHPGSHSHLSSPPRLPSVTQARRSPPARLGRNGAQVGLAPYSCLSDALLGIHS